MADIAKVSVVISAIDQATETIDKVKGQFGALESHWGKLVSAFGIGAGITFLTHLVGEAIEAGDRLNELSQITGVSIKTLSLLQLAAKTSGVDMETVARGIGRMSIAMLGMTDRGDETAGVFDRLGIAVRDANGQLRPTEDVLLDVADRFAEAEGGAAKLAIAAEVFGKKLGPQLIPFLNLGRDGLREMMETARALGFELDDKTGRSMDAVNDTLTIMGMQSKGLGNTIAKALLPTLEGLSRLWLDNAKSGSSFADTIGTFVAGALKSVVTVAMGAYAAFKAVGSVLAGLVAAALAQSKSAAWEALKAGFADAGAAISGTSDAVAKLWRNELPGLSTEQKKLAGSLNEATKPVRAQADEMERLLATLRTKAAQDAAEVALGRKLTDAQKEYVGILQRLSDGTLKATSAQKEQLAILMAKRMEDEKAALAQDQLNKLLEKYAEATAKGIDTAQKSLATIREQIDKQRQHNAELGLSGDALAYLEQRKYLDAAASAEQYANMLVVAGESENLIKLYRDQAVALRELAGLKGEGLLKEAHLKAAEEAQKQWDKTAEQMGQSLSDWIMNGGKNAADYLKGLFRSMVLTPLLRPILTAGVNAIGSALGLAPAVASAGTVGSTLSNAGGALGWLGALGSSFGAGVFGGLGSIGLTSGVGLGGTLSAAGSLIGTGTAAGIGSGITMGLGAIAPYALAAIAGVSLLGKLFGGGETRYGAQYGLAGGRAFKIEGPSGGDPQAAQTIAAIESANALMQSAIATFGGAAGGISISRAGYELSKESGHRFSEIFVNGVGRRQYGMASNEDVGTAFSADLQRAVLLGLQQAQLERPFAEYFAKLNAFALSPEQIQQAVATANAARSMADAVQGLGGVFSQLSGLSVDARTNVLGLVGGLDQFVSKVGSYVSAFYSQTEQAAIQAAAIERTLQAAGVTGDFATREQFRAAVDALNLSDAAGQAQLAAFLNVAQQFAGISDYLQQNNLTLQQLADQAPQDRMADLLTKNLLPVEQTAKNTQDIAAGIGTLRTVMDSVASAVNSVYSAVNASAGSIGAAVSGAVSGLANRPINVEVTIDSPEVNGGLVGTGNEH